MEVKRRNSIFLTDFEEFTNFKVNDYCLNVDIRYLSDKSKKKAEETLNETDEVKEKALKKFSELIQNEKNLFVPRDNRHFLLKFLRARKFDVNEAFKLMKEYFKFKVDFPEIFQNIVPSECARIYAMNAGIISPVKDQYGQRVIMGRAELFDPDLVTPMEFIAAFWVIGEILLMEPESQVNGFVGVVDCKGFSYRHSKKISLTLIKLGIRLAKNVVPAMPKRLHLINQNHFTTVLYKIIKPFLPREYAEMIHFHGDNLEELHEFVPKECLLECFGGTIRDPQITEEQYRDLMVKFDAEYKALNDLGYRTYPTSRKPERRYYQQK